MFSRTWKVEGSIFNGREPDEHRTDIEVRKLDSYAARIFYNPNEQLELQRIRARIWRAPRCCIPRSRSIATRPRS